MTIRTVTFNSGFDHTVVVDHIEPGEVGKVLRWSTHAGGKGLNVSRAISAMGGETVAYSLVGATDRAEFAALADRDGYSLVSIALDGVSTRRNLTLIEKEFDAPAGHAAGRRFSRVPRKTVDELLESLLGDIEPGDLVSFNGSLPDDSRPETWAEVAGAVIERGAQLFADVQGQAMLRLLRTGHVHAAKPNEFEARVLVESEEDLTTIERASLAVGRMHALGVADPIVTLGRFGAVHVRGSVIVHSTCPPDTVRVEVGAGDVFVAGYCVAATSRRWLEIAPVHVGLAAASAHVDGIEGGELALSLESRLARVDITDIASL